MTLYYSHGRDAASAMVIKFDERFLVNLGLGALPPEDSASLLTYIHQSLQVRVFERVPSHDRAGYDNMSAAAYPEVGL